MTKSKETNPLKNAIFNAIKHKDANAVKMLLTDANPHRLAEVVSDNLYWACVKKDEQIVEMLLQKGANPNISVQGRLPLHKVCADGNKNIAEMLLAAGANFSHMDEDSGILFEKIGGTELWFFLELVEGCRKGDLNFIYNGAKHINKPRLMKFID
ncbi:MAG: hypothetical protein RLZZ81_196 [Pseudomonadota bacterium]|jgi:hypothetical protein